MCRLLGVVSDSAAPIGALLAPELDEFLGLSQEHADGWGIAYRNGDETIRIVKDTRRGRKNDPSMRAALDQVTDMAVLHLRLATPGLPVAVGNTHPFGDARLAFAHNGEIRPRDVLDRWLEPALLAGAEGDTDSERYFLAIRAGLDRGDRPEQAIGKAAGEIVARAESCVSLNCLLLSPSELVAYAEHDPDSDVVARRGPGYFRLGWHSGPDRTLIASEGLARQSWSVVPERHVLQVSRGDRRPRVRRAR